MLYIKSICRYWSKCLFTACLILSLFFEHLLCSFRIEFLKQLRNRNKSQFLALLARRILLLRRCLLCVSEYLQNYLPCYTCPGFFCCKERLLGIQPTSWEKKWVQLTRIPPFLILTIPQLRPQTCSYIMNHLGESFYDFVPINAIISQEKKVQRILNTVC